MKTLLLLSLVLSSAAYARPFTWDGHKFRIDVPSSWQQMENFLGVPLTLLGDIQNGVRPIIQVIPTNTQALKLNEAELKSFNEKFPKENEAWLKKREGSLIALLSAKVEKVGENDAVVAGMSYRLPTQAFTEKNYYLNCKDKLYQLKLLVPYGNNKDLGQAEKIVGSFKCGH